ncbi:MAG: LytTR family DNA-binding domain-containing protein [Opitutaceae bacterium]
MSDSAISVIIVDDEPLGRDLVRHMLAPHPEFRIAAECGDGDKALAAIKRHVPRVVFLDIKMPRLDGMSALHRIDIEPRPLVVFITAHDAYAIEAFAADAFDYLLKPFDQERFDQALARVLKRLHEIDAAKLGQSVRHLVTAPPAPPPSPAPAPSPRVPSDRIVVRESGRVYFVAIADIEWLEASGNYVALHVTGGKTHLVHETMAAMEAKLDPAHFARIHRSTIVRIERIKELLPHFNGEYVVVLKDNTRLKLSRSYLESARAALGLG